MTFRWIFLPLVLVSAGLWFLLWKGFARLTVWLCEGGLYLLIDRYEAAWEGVRMEVLLTVGVMIAGFFILFLVAGIQQSRKGWER